MTMYKIFMVLILAIISCNGKKENSGKPEQVTKQQDTIKVMTFNMWHGGDAGEQPLSKTIEVIRKAGAGIVGGQETHGYGEPRPDNSAQMAGNMGWRHVDQGNYDAVMTKYTVEETTTDRRAVKIKIGEGRYIWMINTHLNYIPYQPYQLNDKEYGDYPFISTEKETIYWADRSRKKEVDSLVKLVKEKMDDGWPVIVTGDFNEPSHLDWTERAAKAGLNKISG